jgi:hypothetical protein
VALGEAVGRSLINHGMVVTGNTIDHGGYGCGILPEEANTLQQAREALREKAERGKRGGFPSWIMVSLFHRAGVWT